MSPAQQRLLYHLLLVLAGTGTHGQSTEQNNNKCRVYLAESTIPGAGLGVYSGIDVPEGADISIPTFDTKGFHDTGILSEYIRDGEEYAMHYEAKSVRSFFPGILALVNGYPALNNVGHKTLISSDGAGLHRHKDPGAGGFTSYFNFRNVATAPIKAGMELFGDYDDDWYEEREEKIGSITLNHHYEEADSIASDFHDFTAKLAKEVDEDAFDLFWNFIREDMVSDEHVTKLLPESRGKLENVIKIGAKQLSAPKNLIRSPEWLEEHGLCMDNLRADISTVPQAGRGAFATRFLTEGSTIAPMPLIHHCNKDGLVYHPDDDGEQKRKQVLLNYCFGHRSSTLLLCPYGALTGLVNHKSDSPNAKIRWSTSKYNNADWLKMSLYELCATDHTGLMFDLVAARDISPGDEIFIDYGEEWEMAWKKHVETWAPPEDSESYVSASILNKTEIVLKAYREQELDPYPENVHTECYFRPGPDETQDRVVNNVLVKQYQGYDSNYDLKHCSIHERKSVLGTNTYDSVMWVDFASVLVEKMPREAIRFVDEPYTTDMHLESAFRHEIMIPDELFPAAWKNKE